MKVKQLLDAYNIGRSGIMVFWVVDTSKKAEGRLSIPDVADGQYFGWGDLKVNSFTVDTETKSMTIYAR